jgi:hypothetical protein
MKLDANNFFGEDKDSTLPTICRRKFLGWNNKVLSWFKSAHIFAASSALSSLQRQR